MRGRCQIRSIDPSLQGERWHRAGRSCGPGLQIPDKLTKCLVFGRPEHIEGIPKERSTLERALDDGPRKALAHSDRLREVEASPGALGGLPKAGQFSAVCVMK